MMEAMYPGAQSTVYSIYALLCKCGRGGGPPPPPPYREQKRGTIAEMAAGTGLI